MAVSASEAPRKPPASLLDAYTLHGTIPMDTFYVDDASYSVDVMYDQDELTACVEHAHKAKQQPRLLATRGGGVARDLVARALFEGGASAVKDADVVVFGATDPWVECLSVAAGAKSVLTIEYQNLTYQHASMRTMPALDFERGVRDGGRLAATFDVAIALSAFDHDGLGRYGDRLHPAGDLLAMRTAWRALRPISGRLLLSAPVGPDLLVWNLHRRYGATRLPMLLRGWQEDARLGWDEGRLTANSDHRRRYEPLFVLRRNASTDLDVDVDARPHVVEVSPTGETSRNGE